MNGVGSARQIPHQWGGYIGAERVGTGRLVAVTSVRRWWLHRCQRWWLHPCGDGGYIGAESSRAKLFRTFPAPTLPSDGLLLH